jgi:hypothetical protein
VASPAKVDECEVTDDDRQRDDYETNFADTLMNDRPTGGNQDDLR